MARIADSVLIVSDSISSIAVRDNCPIFVSLSLCPTGQADGRFSYRSYAIGILYNTYDSIGLFFRPHDRRLGCRSIAGIWSFRWTLGLYIR